MRLYLPDFTAPSAKLPNSNPIMERLEYQLAWYDRKSVTNQRAYKRTKVVEILAEAIIPFLAPRDRQAVGLCP